MITAKSDCGKYLVQIYPNGKGGEYGWMASALFNDGQNYGGPSWWFSIGSYKLLSNAKRQSIKKMERHNISISFD